MVTERIGGTKGNELSSAPEMGRVCAFCRCNALTTTESLGSISARTPSKIRYTVSPDRTSNICAGEALRMSSLSVRSPAMTVVCTLANPTLLDTSGV